MSLDLPGFVDPVAEAQATFRAVLDAMAHPGRVRAAGPGLRPPAPLMPGTAALLLTLVDAETMLWLAPDFAPARDWVVFHTGAPPADDPARAAFAIAPTLPDLSIFSSGTDEAPESSATLIVQIAGFGTGQRLRLSGPGVRDVTALDVDCLPPNFPALWAANHALYPRGVDLVLVAGNDMVALPRSLAVERG
jgi:alpha-D-ribose 1-methylphosphonate 5-triphosphate synthase subunit PhnH